MNLTFQKLKPSQIDDAKTVIIKGCFEFFGRAPMDFEDMENIFANYAVPMGTFLVLLDGSQVVGTGAIRKLDTQICELKRMWFLPNYRGKGYGRQMAELLFEFARAAGYKKVRLDTTEILENANKLYQRLGFYPIERYSDGHGTIFMEKHL